MDSDRSSYLSEDKKEELPSPGRPSATAKPALQEIKEEDADEARKLVGDERVIFSEEEMARVRSKIDWRVPPILAAVYFTQFLDKTSLNYSSVMGLPITGEQYNLVSLAFYFGFLVWEMPTNYIAQRFPMAKYLGTNIILWAAILMLHAVAPSFAPFFVLRFLLGMMEACVSPILIAMVAAWYPKNEQSTRIASSYAMNGVTMIIGGLLAFGVTFYTGNNIAHWRIIYILVGGLAFIIGVVVLLFLPDSPATAKFLSERDRIIAIERVRDNQSGTVNHRFKREQLVEALCDVRTWLVVLAVMILDIPSGGFTNFTSIIIKSFGYTAPQTLLLALPQGAVLTIATFASSYWADKKNQRMLPLVATIFPTVLGAAMLVGLDYDRIRFKGPLIFAMCILQSLGASLSLLYAWSATNIAGSTKKATVNALLMIAFATGNMVGTQIFQASDAPGYLPGKVASLILYCSLGVVALILRWVNKRLNVKKAEVLAQTIAANGWSEDDVQRERDRAAFLDMTDKENIFFTYVE